VSASICVVGSFMMDFTVRVSRQPLRGETIIGERFDITPGGKGMNQAVAAARAGARTTMIGVLGEDELGDRFIEALKSEGIDAGLVRRDPSAGTGVGLPMVMEDGENAIVIVPRANSSFSSEDVARVRPALLSSDVVLVQFELPLGPVAEATREIRQGGGLVILNPAPALAPPPGIQFDYLVANSIEATHFAAGSGLEPEALASHLYESWTPKGVVITLGADGLVYEAGDGPVVVKAEQVDAVDTVGAGDAFCGYLAASLAEGASLSEAVEIAKVAGALCVTRPGAVDAIPTSDEVGRYRSARAG